MLDKEKLDLLTQSVSWLIATIHPKTFLFSGLQYKNVFTESEIRKIRVSY